MHGPCADGTGAHRWKDLLTVEPGRKPERMTARCVRCGKVRDVGSNYMVEMDGRTWWETKCTTDQLLSRWDREHNRVTWE